MVVQSFSGLWRKGAVSNTECSLCTSFLFQHFYESFLTGNKTRMHCGLPLSPIIPVKSLVNYLYILISTLLLHSTPIVDYQLQLLCVCMCVCENKSAQSHSMGIE